MKKESVMSIIEEALRDYSDPLYIIGNMDRDNGETITTISATMPREELVIIGNKYPDWYLKVVKNASKDNNILCIADFDKISTEEQKLFIDIICKQYISSEKLPENLKIIVNANEPCPLISEISEVVQYFEL